MNVLTPATIFLAAETALTTAERAHILSRSVITGTSVAAILAEMSKRDTFGAAIDILQRDSDAQTGEVFETAARICMASSTVLDITVSDVLKMAERIRPLVGWSEAELRAEQGKRAKLEMLAPLGFVDAEDGECPDYIYHPAIGSLDSRKVSLADVVSIAYETGRRHGANELRRSLRQLLNAAQAFPTEPEPQ